MRCWKVNMSIIAIDFDGTCVTHDYPLIGKDIGAVPILKRLVEKGNQLILYTMRSDKELEDAKQWFVDNKIPLLGANENPAQKRWTTSPKIYAHIYIDDAALGCPTRLDHTMSSRPYVEWAMVELMLQVKGAL